MVSEGLSLNLISHFRAICWRFLAFMKASSARSPSVRVQLAEAVSDQGTRKEGS